jgi:hypothetical protein
VEIFRQVFRETLDRGGVEREEGDKMEILPSSVGIKRMRRDGPEPLAGPTLRRSSSIPDDNSYSTTPELKSLAESLAQIEHVRSARVAEVEQRLQAGLYHCPEAIAETARVMCECQVTV